MATIDLFGLDISNKKIVLTRCEPDGKDLKIKNLNEAAIQPGLIDSESIDTLKVLANEITAVHKASGIKTKNCVLSVPEKKIFSRLISLPKMNDEETSEAIHWALRPLVPIEIDKLNVTYLGINSFQKEGKEFINWYVVGAAKELIEKYMNVIKLAGLNLLAVETEALALTRMVFHNYDVKQDVLIVDIRDNYTNLVLSRNRSVVFSQTIDLGMENMIKTVASDYGIDEVQAARYMIAFGLDEKEGEGKILKTLAPVIDLLVGEIGRTISYYKEKIGGGTLSTIYLTGPGSNLKKMEEYFATKFSIAILHADLFQKFKLDKSVEEVIKKTGGGDYEVSIGLSLKGLI